ncbi:MAG TPA: complex I subunit 5 family protein [Acidobacteriaceae bacterium]|jgi:multicomponent Na+:H+ antiporter subunit D|nr:complex I subunit 5 family protein [Acidobacteriaceae bacterium]
MPSPALLIVIPLIVAGFLEGFRKLIPRWLADLVSVLTGLNNFVLASAWTIHALARTQVYWFGDWYPRGHMALGIGFVMDGAGCAVAALTGLLATLSLLYSWKYAEHGGGHYHPLMLVFLGAMSGFAVTGDLFNMFVFFELMSTAAFALCGLKTQEPAPLAGAFNFAVTNTVAAFMMLTGIGMLYSTTGALNLAQIGLLLTGRHDRLVLAAFVFLMTGFLVKAAAVPFHFWLPDAHAVAPTSVCVLFSGIMVPFGLFGAMRVYATVFQGSFAPTQVHWLFVGSGAVTALWGGMMCFAEHHVKRMLAFSTISHTGLMTLAFGLWSKDALTGLFLYLVAHGLIKAALFFTAGILLHRFRTISEPALFGRGKALPWTAVLWMLGGLGLAAAPGFALYAGEARVTSRAPWTEGIFLIAGVLTGGAVIRVGLRVFYGIGDRGPTDKSAEVDETPETDADSQRIPWFLFFPPLLCIGTAVALTFWPAFTNAAYSSAVRFLDFRSYAHAVYASATAMKMLTAAKEPLEPDLLFGLLRAGLAAGLAVWAVQHLKVPRRLRWPSHLEGSMDPVRSLQSGHPGDYVAWLTVGFAILGAAAFWLGI